MGFGHFPRRTAASLSSISRRRVSVSKANIASQTNTLLAEAYVLAHLAHHTLTCNLRSWPDNASFVMTKSQLPSVFVVDPYHEAAIKKLRSNAGIRVVLPGDPERRHFLQEATAIMMRSETVLDATAFEQASPRLKFVIKQGVGLDNIDLDAARRKGIQVFNTPALNSESVAELAVTLALCIARRVCEFDRRIRAGDKIVRSAMLGKSLFGKTIGIVGMGNIGFEVAKKWQGAMNGFIVAYDPYSKTDAWSQQFSDKRFRRVETLEEVLEDADVLTLHVPLTQSTSNLISSRELAMMKDDSILINCSRGGIVDEAALPAALDEGRIYGAGLDAQQYEPPVVSRYGDTLLRHPKVVMTPHAGASTEENQARSGTAVVDVLFAILAGKDSHQSPKPVNM